VRYAFIRTQQDSHSITALCGALEVSRSGYHDWLARGVARVANVMRGWPRGSEWCTLRAAALTVRRGSPPRCKVRASVNEKRVARVMKDQAICGRAWRKYRATTDSAHAMPVAKNVLKRRFNPKTANRAWASDITAIATDEGWLYLAMILDLCTRQVVGFAQAEHMRADLVREAFLMAYWRGKPAKGLVFHSDRGSQYCERSFGKLLRGLGVKQSMSRKANCWDNAVAESFFHSLKVEEVGGQRYQTRLQAKAAISNYILGFYNPLRLHSTLGYLSPNAFARNLAKAA
jgi:putative transposase